MLRAINYLLVELHYCYVFGGASLSEVLMKCECSLQLSAWITLS